MYQKTHGAKKVIKIKRIKLEVAFVNKSNWIHHEIDQIIQRIDEGNCGHKLNEQLTILDIEINKAFHILKQLQPSHNPLHLRLHHTEFYYNPTTHSSTRTMLQSKL